MTKHQPPPTLYGPRGTAQAKTQPVGRTGGSIPPPPTRYGAASVTQTKSVVAPAPSWKGAGGAVIQAMKSKSKKGGSKGKWGVYADALKWNGKTVSFQQYVPNGADSIERALESQQLVDAVYNPRKAFWVSDGSYKLSSSKGKTLMEYTFTKEGARSLLEDSLICGSGDFADDNPEVWVGEAAHPNCTIWKTNEMGARGIGYNRLQALQSELVSIKVVG